MSVLLVLYITFCSSKREESYSKGDPQRITLQDLHWGVPTTLVMTVENVSANDLSVLFLGSVIIYYFNLSNPVILKHSTQLQYFYWPGNVLLQLGWHFPLLMSLALLKNELCRGVQYYLCFEKILQFLWAHEVGLVEVNISNIYLSDSPGMLTFLISTSSLAWKKAWS